MLNDVRLAISLQTIDLRIAELQKETAALPRHIAEIEKKLVSHQRRLDMDRAALAANQKDRKLIEGEGQVQQQKISKLRDQMAGAKNNDQFRAFQNEIDFCNREIQAGEDRVLQLMGESELLEKNVKAAEAALKVERQQVDAEKAEAEKSSAAHRATIATLQSERAQVVASMAPAVSKTYDRIRKARGTVVSEAIGGRCSACHLTLRPQFHQELKRGEKLMNCENCGRILYWNPPKSADELTGMNAVSR